MGAVETGFRRDRDAVRQQRFHCAPATRPPYSRVGLNETDPANQGAPLGNERGAILAPAESVAEGRCRRSRPAVTES